MPPTIVSHPDNQAPTEFPTIEVFENKYPDRDYIITHNVPEFTSVCPKTGMPDFGKVTVEYIPDKLCIELKAFKYYVHAYRNHGAFYETVINKILDDLVNACNPRVMTVSAEFTPRGGISSSIEVSYQQDGYDTSGCGHEH
jgi:7-cyano-7-deazaguanine reductase